MERIGTIAAIALIAGPALAAGEIPFEKAGGWDVERAAKGSTCLASKSYKDANDNDAENALVFAVVADKAVMTFVYEHWTWKKGERIRAPLVFDQAVALPQSNWTGDGQTMTAELPNSIVPRMLTAKKMIVKLDGADADFDLAGFALAHASLLRCEAAAKAPAGTAAASSTESAHIAKATTFPGDGDVPPRSTFMPDTPKIVLGLQVRGLKPDDKLTGAWIAEKTDVVASNFQIASLAVTPGTNRTVSLSLNKPDAGWPPGRYWVDVRINEQPVEFRQYFDIEGKK